MLFLVGLGLEVGDISTRALQRLKAVDIIKIDVHTNKVPSEQLSFLEKELGKKFVVMERSDLEEKVKDTIKEAKEKDIAIVTMGDPMIATTHHIILDEASRLCIKVEIFHAPSIFSAAIGASGLDIYRFGPTTTIPFWTELYKPTSFLEVVAKNQKNGEHTLILLDYNYKEGKAMDLSTALSIIGEAEKSRQVLGKSQKIMILGGIGTNSEAISYVEIAKAKGLSARFEGKLLSIIVPAEPNFAEEEALRRFTASST